MGERNMNHDYETNKKNVQEFYDFLINKKDFRCCEKIYGK